MNDAELVRKILAGDEDRFGEIVERYARRVWALCASYIHNPSDCEDLVQESFIHGYLRLNTIREPNAFGAWLGQVARTRCLEWLRKRTREKDAITGLKEGPVEAPADTTPSESAQREEMHAFVRRNLDALKVSRTVSLLHRRAFGRGSGPLSTFRQCRVASNLPREAA